MRLRERNARKERPFLLGASLHEVGCSAGQLSIDRATGLERVRHDGARCLAPASLLSEGFGTRLRVIPELRCVLGFVGRVRDPIPFFKPLDSPYSIPHETLVVPERSGRRPPMTADLVGMPWSSRLEFCRSKPSPASRSKRGVAVPRSLAPPELLAPKAEAMLRNDRLPGLTIPEQ